MRSLPFVRALGCALLLWGATFVQAQSFQLLSLPVDLDRWMYPNGFDGGGRASASVFATLGTNSGTDTRLGQFLIGWNTSNSIPSGRGLTNYLVRSARVTLTINRDLAYVYDGTYDKFETYLTNDVRYVADSDAGRPVELSGAGFRGGYTSLTYPENGPHGSESNRTAYAAMYSTNGVLIDVGNNVGKKDSDAFEVTPFAIGISTNVAPGQLMATGHKMTFDLNLNDPLIYGYVQQALNDGGIRFMVSSLLEGNYFSGSPNYAQFYTRDHPLANADEMPLFDIDATAIRSTDSDTDGLPDDWEQFYFNSLSHTATEDADADGQNNLQEFLAGTNPVQTASTLRLLTVKHQLNSTELKFSFAASRNYTIQWSDDLLQWQSVTNAVLTYPSTGVAVWRDTNAVIQQRFYRIGTP